MAQDPYGYKESGPAMTSGGDGAMSMWLGFASLMLCAIGPCMCQVPFLIAFPVGAYATYAGYTTLADAPADDGNTRAMGTAGMIGGLVSALIAGGFIAFWVLYVGFLFVMMGMGAAFGNG